MSHPLSGMIDSTLQRIRDIVDVNSVVGRSHYDSGGRYHSPDLQNQLRFWRRWLDFSAKAASPAGISFLAAAPGWEFG